MFFISNGCSANVYLSNSFKVNQYKTFSEGKNDKKNKIYNYVLISDISSLIQDSNYFP